MNFSIIIKDYYFLFKNYLNYQYFDNLITEYYFSFINHFINITLIIFQYITLNHLFNVIFYNLDNPSA